MPSAKNKFRVVLDTNVYISALLFGGIPEQIIELSRDGEIELLVSPAILLELGRILQDKFDFSKIDSVNVLSEIRRIAAVILPNNKINFIKDDPADDRILECAVEGRADCIVTGDKKHLRPLGNYLEIKILLPSEFIKL